MAKTFNTIEELMIYLQKQIPVSLEAIGEEVKKILRDNVQQLWYDRPFTPTHYTRSMEYINSIVCSKATKISNGQYRVEIYFATDLIQPYMSPNGEWNQHASIYGEDVSAQIPYYIEEGNNSPLFEYQGVHPVKITKEWIEDNDYLRKRMIKFLGKYGFNCSVI